MTDNSGPGYRQHPDHRVDLTPADGKFKARAGGEIIAESDHVILVAETGYKPVPYFPRADIRMAALQRTDQHTHCPYKGDASYFSITAGDTTAENAAWSYETPFDEVTGLAAYIAFYPNKVEITGPA